MSHTFGVWAPDREHVTVRVDGADHPMTAQPGGWWQATVTDATTTSEYGFLLDDDATLYPDPRSRHQPHGVDGPSRLVDDAAHTWHDGAWRGVPLAGAVLYELHVGTFTEEGTFAAAVERLDHLVDLGVDVVELLPVNGFDGTHGWGYDGVRAVGRARRPTAARRGSSTSSTPATPAASGSSSTSSTTTSARAATISRGSARTSPTRT